MYPVPPDLTRASFFGSPWGLIQRSKTLIPGVSRVHTHSHGGLLLSEERWAEFQKKLPNFVPFAEDGALEEHSDIAFGMLCFADEMQLSEEDRYFYCRSVLNSRQASKCEDFVAQLREEVARFEHKNRDLFRLTCWTTGGGSRTEKVHQCYVGQSLDGTRSLVVRGKAVPNLPLATKEAILAQCVEVESVRDEPFVPFVKPATDELPSTEPVTPGRSLGA